MRMRDNMRQRLHYYLWDTSDLGTEKQSWKTLSKFYKNACEEGKLLRWKMWNMIDMMMKYLFGDSWEWVEREEKETGESEAG